MASYRDRADEIADALARDNDVPMYARSGLASSIAAALREMYEEGTRATAQARTDDPSGAPSPGPSDWRQALPLARQVSNRTALSTGKRIQLARALLAAAEECAELSTSARASDHSASDAVIACRKAERERDAALAKVERARTEAMAEAAEVCMAADDEYVARDAILSLALLPPGYVVVRREDLRDAVEMHGHGVGESYDRLRAALGDDDG